MINMAEQGLLADYLRFMEEYVGFFEQTADAEETEYRALLENDLKKIQTALSHQQAILLKTNSMEKQRLEYQSALGFGQMTFQEVIAALDDADAAAMTALYTRLTGAVQSIKRYNAESMQLAENRMKLIDSLTPESAREVFTGYAPKRKKEADRTAVSTFETKI